MSFEKAREIIDLYTSLSASYMGVTINDVVDEYGVSRRTAQRMLHLTEDMFFAETYSDNDGLKRWRIKTNVRKELVDIIPEELATLEMAIELMEQQGQPTQATQLKKLKNKISALIPNKKTFSLSTDLEALLEAQGYAIRRGPRPIIDQDVLSKVGEAIKGCSILVVTHKSEYGKINEFKIAPYGILYGTRPYLVAHFHDNGPDEMRYFRLDKVLSAELTDDYFERAENFDLNTYSRKSYSIYQDEKEFGDVEWKFTPDAAEEARCYLFHPDQDLIEEKDGSLTVKFKASGYLEMCWDLYQWGDKVEIIKPVEVHELCKNFKRTDFPGLP